MSQATDMAKHSLNVVQSRPVRRWIIHPGLLAGDPWHVVGAMLCDPSVRVIIVVHQSIYDLWREAIVGVSVDDLLADLETTSSSSTSGRSSALGSSPSDTTSLSAPSMAAFLSLSTPAPPPSLTTISPSLTPTPRASSSSSPSSAASAPERLAVDRVEAVLERGRLFLKKSAGAAYKQKIRSEPVGVRKANLAQRLVVHWQQTVALLELLEASGIDRDRYWLLPYNPDYHASSNPYTPAARSVIDAQKNGVPAEHDPVVEMNQGDFVGITQSSTSAIVKRQHTHSDALRILSEQLAPERDAFSREAVSLLLNGCMAPALEANARVLFLILRYAEENRVHNTTSVIVEQVLEEVKLLNASLASSSAAPPFRVLPVGTHIEHNKAKVRFTEVNFRESAPLLQPLDLFAELDKIDGREYPVLTSRTLIAEFWRQVARHQSACVLGGRSGSVDIACFMGCRTASWDEFVTERDHMRLCTTHRFMSILELTNGHLDTDALASFLMGQPTPTHWLRHINAAKGFHSVHRHTKREALTLTAYCGSMTKTTGRGWALLLYDDSEAPWAGAQKADLFKDLTPTSTAPSSSSPSSSPSARPPARKRRKVEATATTTTSAEAADDDEDDDDDDDDEGDEELGGLDEIGDGASDDEGRP